MEQLQAVVETRSGFRLDPRTKLLLMAVVATAEFLYSHTAFMIAVALIPFVLLLTNRQYKTAIVFFCLFTAGLFVQAVQNSIQFPMVMVRSVDVARHMEVSKPSVCHAVATLRDGGFLTMDEDHFLHLTDVGREVAEKIYERHCFFTEQLIAAGVDPRIAEADACRIEHIISDESFSRLKEAAAQDQE